MDTTAQATSTRTKTMTTATKRTGARTTAYWITTGLVTLVFLAGGITDVARPANVVAIMNHLGYPLYFATILGIWKLLGAATVVVPAPARLKEWAYAGMFFDLTGAAFSHAASGDPAKAILTPLVILGLVIASWALRPSASYALAHSS
ncbi:MAG TPA: DoxX family protein [Polyangia bacterium]|jgi:uncharacterized membrane protein|nr:DoxX family protein [Polyangia bacterium]